MQVLDEFGRFTESGNSEILTAWLTKTIEYQYTPANEGSKISLFIPEEESF
jgi:hypothetical protein